MHETNFCSCRSGLGAGDDVDADDFAGLDDGALAAGIFSRAAWCLSKSRCALGLPLWLGALRREFVVDVADFFRDIDCVVDDLGDLSCCGRWCGGMAHQSMESCLVAAFVRGVLLLGN